MLLHPHKNQAEMMVLQGWDSTFIFHQNCQLILKQTQRQTLPDLQHYLPRLIKSFGMEFKRALIFDRVSEELRLFCANQTIDEVRQVCSSLHQHSGIFL